MAAQGNYAWRRDKVGLGVWEHRGKVAVAGYGHSPVDRRWDGVSMDQTLGAYSILACQKAMDDAGVTADQIDGVICCDSHIAGASGGSRGSAAARASRCGPTIVRSSRRAEVRYFLDTEYNGWGGALLSLALVPQEGEELYLTLDWEGPLDPWVERNVLPYLDTVPDALVSPRMSRADAARTLAHYLAGDADPVIVADWPEDIALFNALLVTGPGTMIEVPALTFRFLPLGGFSTAANSKVPHNALHDARALRDHVLALE